MLSPGAVGRWWCEADYLILQTVLLVVDVREPRILVPLSVLEKPPHAVVAHDTVVEVEAIEGTVEGHRKRYARRPDQAATTSQVRLAATGHGSPDGGPDARSETNAPFWLMTGRVRRRQSGAIRIGPQPLALATVNRMPSWIRRFSVRRLYGDNDPSMRSSPVHVRYIQRLPRMGHYHPTVACLRVSLSGAPSSRGSQPTHVNNPLSSVRAGEVTTPITQDGSIRCR